jgi:hypothetical protein
MEPRPQRRTTLTARKPLTSQNKETKQSRLTPVGTSRRRITPKVESRPLSPRDKTPLILEGLEIPREDIPPIALPPPSEEEEVPENTSPASPEKQPVPQEDLLANFSFTPKREITIPDPDVPVPLPEEDISRSPQREPTPELVPLEKPKVTPAPVEKPKVTPAPVEKPKVTPAPVEKPKVASTKVIPKTKSKKAPPKKLQAPNFSKMDQSQRIQALVTYRKRFMNLRDAFPGLGVRKIPEELEPTPQNLLLLHDEYDGYMTHVLVSEDVSQSMIILIIILGGIELFLTKVLHLPASNYVIKQFKLINKYRGLLYELGEERIASAGGRSPPLVRIIYLILLTSIATVGIRLFEKYIGATGASIAENFVYNILGGGGADAPASDPTEGLGGGFDLNGLLKLASGFLGGGGAPAASQGPSGPVYDE